AIAERFVEQMTDRSLEIECFIFGTFSLRSICSTASPAAQECAAGPTGVNHLAAVALAFRRDLNAARTSSEKTFGCSHAAKCPPLSGRLKYMSFGYARSAQLRGAWKTSSGKALTAAGM